MKIKEIKEVPVVKKFEDKEEALLVHVIERFKRETGVDFERTNENIRNVLEMAHDRYGLIWTPEHHKLMYSMIGKTGAIFETPAEKSAREDLEAKIKRRTVRAELKEQIIKQREKELKDEIKHMGLENLDDPEPPEVPEPPRQDETTVEFFNNFEEVKQERMVEQEKAKAEAVEAMPDLHYDDFTKNTVIRLKELANFLKIDYLSNIKKDELIAKINEKIG
jgi:hypothetical protein